MDKFLIDGNNQRIIRLRDDMPQGADFNEAYVQYTIPMGDISGLVEALKANGDIKPEIVEVAKEVAKEQTIYDNPNVMMHDIMNTQAKMLDRQLVIIEKMLK